MLAQSKHAGGCLKCRQSHPRPSGKPANARGREENIPMRFHKGCNLPARFPIRARLNTAPTASIQLCPGADLRSVFLRASSGGFIKRRRTADFSGDGALHQLNSVILSSPLRQGAEPKHRLGSPAAQIYGKCDALTSISTQNNYTVVNGMILKHRPPVVGDEDGTAPPMCKADGLQHRIEPSYAQFYARDQFRCLARINVDPLQVPPIVHINQTTTENHSTCRE